jgi:hypothetical protein
MDLSRARSVRRGTATLDEIDDIARNLARGEHTRIVLAGLVKTWRADGDYANADLYLHDGDLAIDGDFDTTDVDPYIRLLVVTGDLIVRGRYEDALNPESMVIVTGDLRAENAITEGSLEVHGDIEIGRHAILFDNDCCTYVHGDLTAGELIYSCQNFAMVSGRVTAPLIIGKGLITSPHEMDIFADDDERLMSRLVPAAMNIIDDEPDEEPVIDYLEHEAIIDLVRAGDTPVLRG